MVCWIQDEGSNLKQMFPHLIRRCTHFKYFCRPTAKNVALVSHEITVMLKQNLQIKSGGMEPL